MPRRTWSQIEEIMKRKKSWDEIGQELADNLNRNVVLDHIEFVEKNIRPADDDYYFFKNNIKHYKTLNSYRKWRYSKEYKKS